MSNEQSKLIDDILSNELKDILSQGKLGFEKEGLRVFQSKISQAPHPYKIGSALCNKYITTDFSESQIELITPPIADKIDGLLFLDDIHHFLSINNKDEILWPLSMPPSIKSDEEIPIAKYGSSNIGLFKSLYRNGLSNRYGRLMQSISGIHYNYSLPDLVWETSFIKEYSSNPIKIRSQAYFSMLRNIYRMNWLVLYLFGASPIITKNFISKDKESFKQLNKEESYLPYATSLRMSDFGYHNSRRVNLNVCPNSIEEYVLDLKKATNTISEDFIKIDNNKLQSQINSNILQIEDEYYATARAKSKIISDQRSTSKLMKNGVDFIELRSLDLNPFSRVGIDQETVLFLEVFHIYCFIKSSKPLSKKELEAIRNNDLEVAKYGRKPDLILFNEGDQISLNEWANKIFDEMMPIVELLDRTQSLYSDMMTSIKLKINDPSLTLSGRLLDKIISENISFNDFGNLLGESNKDHYLSIGKQENQSWEILSKEAENSWTQHYLLQEEDNKSFDEFIIEYFND
jgi:glutamate--cysteine ligase